MSISVKINRKSFGKKFTNMLDNSKFKMVAWNKMDRIVDNAKHKMIEQFNHSVITKEIEAGATSENISETLGGYGNLYSFIGFDSSKPNPIIKLRELLRTATHLNQTKRIGDNWYFRVTTPTQHEINEATPMEWEGGNGWAEGIEHGISGLSFYMYKFWEKGRSKTGMQLPEENNEELSFSTHKYLTPIIRDFRAKFK